MRIHAARGTDSFRKNHGLAKALALAVVAASLGSGVSAWADSYGNNGGTTLNLPTSWIDETTPANTGIGVPGAADIAQWDNNDVNAAVTTYTLGADTSWLGIKIVNPTAGVVIGTGVNNLTLGASGIDMSTATQNLTVATLNLLLGSSQSFTVATGRTLTVSAPMNLGGNNLTFTGAGASVVSGVISDAGSGALIVAGPGAVTLSGANTFGGGTTLNAGTLVLNNASALGTGLFTIAGGTINSTTAGTVLNNNPQALNGSFTFTGTQSLNMGTGAVTLGATPTITVTANTLTQGGVISGGFGLTKAGAGTLVLTNANTFTGPVTISAGVVNFNSLAALGAGTVLTFNGGTLQYASGNTADISADTVNFTGNATLDTNGNTVTLANSIGNGGSGNFVKTGTGMLTLATADSYSGNTTVQGSNATVASVLNFASLASLGSGSAINISNGTLQYGSGNTADITARTVTVSGTLATIDVNGNSVSYANPISGTGPLTLASTAGPASVTFNAVSAYKGNIMVNSGVTAVTGNGLAFQSAGVTLNSGSTLSFGNATAVTLGGLTGAQNIALVNAASQNVSLTFGGIGGTYTGILSDNGSNLAVTKIGNSLQILTNGNTYNGDTVINGGALELNFTPGTIGSDILYQQVLAGAVVQGSEGRLVLGGGELYVTNRTNATTYQQFASTVVSAGSSEVAMLGRTSGAKPETLLYGISRTIGGTLEFEPSTGNASGIFTTATNNASGILGGWAVYFGGDWARATATGTNAATGPTLNGIATGVTVQNGVTYTTAATPATAFANNTINTDMTANLTAPSGNTTGSIRFNTPGTIALTTTGANVDASGGILITATVAANAVSIIPASSSSTITSGNGTDLIVIDNDTTVGSTFTIQTTIADNGTPIGLTKSGAGTLVVSGNNTFTGGVYLNAGTTVLGNAGAFNSTTPNALVFSSAYTNTPATLSLNGNSLVTPSITSANVAGSPVIQNASATSAVLTVNGAGASNFSGNIVNGTGAGTLGLTLAGSGSLTLSGSNTYTGDTVISSGTTLVLSSTTSNIANSARAVHPQV